MSRRLSTRLAARLVPVAIVALASAGAMSSAMQISARPSAATSDISLSDDSSGSAMFTVGAMGPGDTVTRCIAVSATPSDVSADVRLYGSVSGALADTLDLVIEAGEGGTYNSCTGFTGQQVFSGTLQQFAGTYTDFGTGLAAWSPDASNRTSYRFSVTLADGATPGADATARFVWEDQVDVAPTPSPSPDVTDTPTASPDVTDTPTAAPTASPTVMPSATPSATRSPTPAPTGTAVAVAQPSQPPPSSPDTTTTTPGDGGGAAPSSSSPSPTAFAPAPAATGTTSTKPGSPSPSPRRTRAAVAPVPPKLPPVTPRPHAVGSKAGSDVLAAFIARLPTPLRAVAHLISPVVRQPGLPALWLLLVLAFLAIQNRIDRRDPKLALAPVFADPDVGFPDSIRRDEP